MIAEELGVDASLAGEIQIKEKGAPCLQQMIAYSKINPVFSIYLKYSWKLMEANAKRFPRLNKVINKMLFDSQLE